MFQVRPHSGASQIMVQKMYSSEVELKSVCRICCENASESTGPVEAKEIWEKISMCFQLTLDSEKYLPCAFCKKCVEDLDSAYSLRTKCVSMYECLQNYCENLPINIIIRRASSELDGGRELMEDSQSENNKQSEIRRIDIKKKFLCNICNKVLKTKKSLMKHIVSMHEKRRHAGKVSGCGSARLHHCISCSYSTPHSQTLINHMRRHNGERPFKCECGKSFTQASSLAAHHKTHSATTFFTCTECGKQFKHAFTLKTHMQVHNSGTYSCNICNKLLKTKRSLTSHMHRHYKIYNFNCEDCGDTFVTSAELHNHKKKHNSKKNIECHACDYVTHCKKNLIAHLKRHEGEKINKCIFCEKAFLNEGNLRRHIRIHTREKPFSCLTCTRRFAHSSSLNNHMLTVHGVRYKWGNNRLKESNCKSMKTENSSLVMDVHK